MGFQWGNTNGADTATTTTNAASTGFSWGNTNGNDNKKDETKTNTSSTPWGATTSNTTSSKPNLDKFGTAPAASTSGSTAFQFNLPSTSSTESKSNGSGASNGFSFGAKPELTPSKTVPSTNGWPSSNGASTSSTNGGSGGLWGNTSVKDSQTDAKTEIGSTVFE